MADPQNVPKPIPVLEMLQKLSSCVFFFFCFIPQTIFCGVIFHLSNRIPRKHRTLPTARTVVHFADKIIKSIIHINAHPLKVKRLASGFKLSFQNRFVLSVRGGREGGGREGGGRREVYTSTTTAKSIRTAHTHTQFSMAASHLQHSLIKKTKKKETNNRRLRCTRYRTYSPPKKERKTRAHQLESGTLSNANPITTRSKRRWNLEPAV